ncbi:hypothetical protein ONZ45_g13772 [Pleurotus djamor]|nr:hypothetical protein ONZ45_g13772 [Pleurotus djamor]
MSNENQKADQIAFHVYTKLTHVVNHARTTTDQRGQPKPDKWFNLETPDSDFFSKEDREPYRALSSYIHPTLPPPLEIQVLLTIPELASNQVLVHLDPDTNTRHRIEPTPRFILLESFILDFAHHGSTSSFSSSSSSTGVADIAPSTMYKHGIPLFRSLYTMLRVMPAWKVFKRLKRRIGRFGGGNMGIVVRLKEPGDDTLEFGTPLASQSHLLPSHILPTQSHTFVPVPHPHGTITLSLQYLTTPTFQIDDKESLFSSGFLAGDKAQSQQQRFGQSPPHVPATTTTPMVSRQPPPPPPDPDVEFVPTLIKNQQRDSIASSAGLGYGTSSSPNHGRSNLSGLSREVTTQSIADRFILPPTQPQQSGVGSPGTAGAAMTQSRTAPASGC